MTLRSIADRSAAGTTIAAEVTGRAAPAAATPLQESWRDFVFAEVWSRPGLDRRSRFLVAIAGAALVGATDLVEAYAQGALATGELALAELREVALHLAVYGGWSRGDLVDAAVTRAAAALGLEAVALPAIRAGDWDAVTRSEEGAAEFQAVMGFAAGPPVTPFLEAIRNFVFGEMWGRYEGLDQRARRWLTLVGVCASSAETPIRSHVHAAMASGNCTAEEMQEFVLQYGIHAGWPRASFIQSVVSEQSRNVAAGLPYTG